MSIEQTVRAWKDPDYADGLRTAGTALAPSPVGESWSPLDDAALARVGGGREIPNTVGGPWVCGILIASSALSCLRCETSIWDGTCGAGSVGCCPSDAV